MNSHRNLIDSLTAHVSLYHSQIPKPSPNPNSNHGQLCSDGSILSRCTNAAHLLTTVDPNFIKIILQMRRKIILWRQSAFQQGFTAQTVQCGATTSEDERTLSCELMDFTDVTNSQEMVEQHDKHWMSEEELEAHAISGMDYNQYFGGGGMYWNPSDHPATSFSRPPSFCSDDNFWAWREADMKRASTNGLTSPSAASFCSPFDSLGSGALGFVMPGS